MIRTVAVQGYRSLRDLVLPLGQLSLITGANGSGKSSVYRSLRLLADAAQNAVVASLAAEGGLPATFWAGPETIARSVRQGEHEVEPLVKRSVASLKLGFGSDDYSYSIDLGYPQPLKPPLQTMFKLDPRIKHECVWHGAVYRKAAALVDRRNNFVWLSTTKDEEPVMLTQHLNDSDSMLASIADPQRAPEMLEVREAVRGWRFYDSFRTDAASPARLAQIGTFSPVLHHDGSNLAAALQTIVELRSDEALKTTIEDAFPGSRLYVQAQNGRFELQLRQHGLLRALTAAELSDGTLRYLLWAAALLSPRPPQLMVLNEPETSLHPDLLPALARMILAAAQHTQIIVVSHAPQLIEVLSAALVCVRLHLVKEFGETTLEGATLFNKPKWVWPAR
jgi:predicted ATPase